MHLTIIFLSFASVAISHSKSQKVAGPLTKDFQDYLKANGYSTYDFVRSDQGAHGSYGGFEKSGMKPTKTPVIFIHGNSDSALKTNSFATGWDQSIEYFLSKGYTTAELYATSWQDNNQLKANSRTHNCKDLTRLRKFFEAILAYTGAQKVSVVSHSMGVTLGRKVVQGGTVTASDGNCNLGLPITNKIDVFIGISGANYGLCNCAGSLGSFAATCNKQNGFWSGDSCGSSNFAQCGAHPMNCSGVPAYSALLSGLNKSGRKDAAFVFSMYSKADDLIGNSDYVFGRPTSEIPLSDDVVVFSSYTHMQTKEKTAADQYKLVTEKKFK